MKKLLIIALLVISNYAFAQVVVQPAPQPTQQPQQQVVYVRAKPAFTPHLRVNGYALYAFDDNVESYYSNTDFFNGTIKGGFQWGGGLEYMMIPNQGIEISYLRLDSEAPMEYYDFNINRVRNTTFDVATNYILIGSNRYFGGNSKIEPYGGIQAGMAIFNVEEQDGDLSGNSTKFAWGAKLGLNIWASDKVGIKMQAGLNSAVQSAGGGLYFGTGGAGAGVSTYSTFYQFYVGGGLTFNMSKN